MPLPRKPWPIPELWPGATVFILGGGPSLADVDLSLLHGQRVIGVNQAFKLGPWVDVLYFGDCDWYHRYGMPEIRQYAGLKISSCSIIPQFGWKHVHRVRRTKPYGIEYEHRDAVAWNNNSGASAINVAYWLGAERVVLVGFDMHKQDGRKNWHDDYRGERHNPDLFDRHLKGFPAIAEDAEKIGLEIINATPHSAITVFPYQPLEDCFETESRLRIPETGRLRQY